jgi:hypothetical protein
MNRSSKAIKLLLLALIPFALLQQSCSYARRAIKAPLKVEGADYLFKKLKHSEIHFNDLSAKFSAEYTVNKKKTTLSGQLRIKHDSLIWISISPLLGIEMARMELTNDSAKYINRISSTYFLRDIDYINELLNKTLDFDMVQAFLLGNDFSFYENGAFRAGIDNNNYKLVTAERHKLKKYVRQNEKVGNIPLQHIWLDPSNFKITHVLVKEIADENRKFEADYSGFQKISEQLFPTELRFNIETGNKKVTIVVNYSKIVFDQQLVYPFRIPENYKPIQEIAKPR